MEWFDCETDLHPKALGFKRQYWIKPAGSMHELWRMYSDDYGVAGTRLCTVLTIDEAKQLAETQNLERVSQATIDEVRAS